MANEYDFNLPTFGQQLDVAKTAGNRDVIEGGFQRGMKLSDTLLKRRDKERQFSQDLEKFKAKMIDWKTAMVILKEAGYSADDITTIMDNITAKTKKQFGIGGGKIHIDVLMDIASQAKPEQREPKETKSQWKKVAMTDLVKGNEAPLHDGQEGQFTAPKDGRYLVERNISSDMFRYSFMGPTPKTGDDKTGPPTKPMPASEKKELWALMGVASIVKRIAENFEDKFVGLGQYGVLSARMFGKTPIKGNFPVFHQNMNMQLNRVIKQVTGAQMSEKEAKRIGGELPKGWESNDVFKSKLISKAEDTVQRIKFILDSAEGVYNPKSIPKAITGNKDALGIAEEMTNAVSRMIKKFPMAGDEKEEQLRGPDKPALPAADISDEEFLKSLKLGK